MLIISQKTETKESNDSVETSKSVAEDEKLAHSRVAVNIVWPVSLFLQLSKAAVSCYICENTSVMGEQCIAQLEV